MIVTIQTDQGPLEVEAELTRADGLVLHKGTGDLGWSVTQEATGFEVAWYMQRGDALLFCHAASKLLGKWGHTIEEMHDAGSRSVIVKRIAEAQDRVHNIKEMIHGK